MAKEKEQSPIVDPGALLFSMMRTVRNWRRELDVMLDHYGLTEARTRPLIYIDRLGNGIRQKDLAGELEIEGSTLVRLLDSLEQAGLIKRRVGKEDRRERKLYLTPAGREMVRHVRELTNRLHLHVLETLSSDQQRMCMNTFDTINEVLAEAADEVDAPGYIDAIQAVK